MFVNVCVLPFATALQPLENAENHKESIIILQSIWASYYTSDLAQIWAEDRLKNAYKSV